MKKFESAHIEFIYFDVSDVVCTSGNEGEGGSGSIDELFGPLDNLN